MQDSPIDRWLAVSGARLLRRGDAPWPAQLAALADPPPVLYALGNVELLRRPQIAIVGSRHPTAAGRSLAARIAGDLAKAGLVITSGLARGIDAAAHEAPTQLGEDVSHGCIRHDNAAIIALYDALQGIMKYL